MNILVCVETDDKKIKSTSLEAVAYAHAMGGTVTAIALGSADKGSLEGLGKFGAKKVLHASNNKLDQPIAQAYATVITKAMADENADVLVLANSSLGTPAAAKIAIRPGAGLASNVVELPDTSSGFSVNRSIYTGKAFSIVEVSASKKIIVIKKNAAELKDVGGNAQVVDYPVDLPDK